MGDCQSSSFSVCFSGGYGYILNNAKICGENNIVGYIYDDELPSFPHHRTVHVSIDDSPLTAIECDNKCMIEATIPADTSPGKHQLILQIPRLSDVVFDIEAVGA